MDKKTMSVQELALYMGISLPKAYEVVHRPDFPSFRVGTRILIPTESFTEWLKKAAEHENTQHRH